MSLDHYWEALDRLERGAAKRIPAGYSINLKTVAMEAGRKSSPIKRSRENHLELIAAIKKAAAKQREPIVEVKKKLARQTDKVKCYKQKYHEALNREIMHLNKIDVLTKALDKANLD